MKLNCTALACFAQEVQKHKIETQTNTDIFNIRKLLSGCKSKRFCNICPVEQIVGHFRAMMWFI